MTTIEATQGKGNVQEFLQVAPSDRLRALLEISTNLSRTLDLDPLLTQIADTLFGVFRQADRCFVMMLDETQRPVPKVVKTRRARQDDTRFSRTIVKKTIDSMQSYLSEDASSDVSLGPAASIAEFKIRSVMCVPLSTSEGKPLGAIQLDTQDRAKKFITDDLNLLTIVANLAGVAIEKARMHETVLDAREGTEGDRAGPEGATRVPAANSPRSGRLRVLLALQPRPDGRRRLLRLRHAAGRSGRGRPRRRGRQGRAGGAPRRQTQFRSAVLSAHGTRSGEGDHEAQRSDDSRRAAGPVRDARRARSSTRPTHRLTVVNAGHLMPKLYRGSQGSLVDAVGTRRHGTSARRRAGVQLRVEGA